MTKIDENRTGRDSDKFMLRLPVGMREAIARAAIENKRSMNAEIISQLQQAAKPDASFIEAALLARQLDLANVARRLAELPNVDSNTELVQSTLDEIRKLTRRHLLTEAQEAQLTQDHRTKFFEIVSDIQSRTKPNQN